MVMDVYGFMVIHTEVIHATIHVISVCLPVMVLYTLALLSALAVTSLLPIEQKGDGLGYGYGSYVYVYGEAYRWC